MSPFSHMSTESIQGRIKALKENIDREHRQVRELEAELGARRQARVARLSAEAAERERLAAERERVERNPPHPALAHEDRREDA